MSICGLSLLTACGTTLNTHHHSASEIDHQKNLQQGNQKDDPTTPENKIPPTKLSELEQLIIIDNNGKAITNINIDDFNENINNLSKTNGYKHITFGRVGEKSDEPRQHFAVFSGQKTQHMPSDKAAITYKGTFYELEGPQYGDVKVTIHFNEHTLRSEFKAGDQLETAEGTIKDNRFTFKNQKGSGYFYGDKAEELGGIYIDPEKNTKIFGAKQSSQ